jgi:hypothetical protein
MNYVARRIRDEANYLARFWVARKETGPGSLTQFRMYFKLFPIVLSIHRSLTPPQEDPHGPIAKAIAMAEGETFTAGGVQ